jgi:hypothetical protein
MGNFLYCRGGAVVDLTHLADLIRIRNYVNNSVSRIISRPAETGHLTEYIASQIFDIELHASAVNKASDGCFRSPAALAGCSVNVKYRSSSSRRLNIENSANLDDHPAYYLAFRGPKLPSGPASEKTLPLVIVAVFLFRAAELIPALVAEGGTNIGPSVKSVYWQAAMIYPEQVNQALVLSEEQRAALRLFAPQGGE